MKTICIHQPDFVPYIGFYQRLLLSQHFIILDDVKFIRDGWQHRDRIKSKYGAAWLTISIKKGSHKLNINQVELSDDGKWIESNLNLLKDAYGKASYFSELFPKIERIYYAGHHLLIDFNIEFLKLAFEYFDISIPISFSSDYKINTTSSTRLLELVKSKEGCAYLTGLGSRDYLDENIFRSAGVSVVWQNFKHPNYLQLHGNFESMLSCLDVFFNCGHDAASILRASINE